jgi:hypothetical protein
MFMGVNLRCAHQWAGYRGARPLARLGRETQGDEAVSSVRATRRRTPWRGYRRDMTDSDLKHLRSAIALSRRSRDRGNQPFGDALPI